MPWDITNHHSNHWGIINHKGNWMKNNVIYSDFNLLKQADTIYVYIKESVHYTSYSTHDSCLGYFVYFLLYEVYGIHTYKSIFRKQESY